MEEVCGGKPHGAVKVEVEERIKRGMICKKVVEMKEKELRKM